MIKTTTEPAITINIMGKDYQIKCPAPEVDSLHQAAEFLEKKMQEMRDEYNVLSIDRIAVITALNIANQFLQIQKNSQQQLQTIEQQIQHLDQKLEEMVIKNLDTEISIIE